MKNKSTEMLSNKTAAAIKAELKKYSDTFNVKETKKIVEEAVTKVTEDLIKEWINNNIDKVVKDVIKEELQNIAKKKL